jgi:polysaccharide biosynthesis transport protein
MPPQPGAPAEPEFRDYLRVLTRRKWVIVLAVAVVAGAALGSSLLQASVYQGKASVLLEPRSTDPLNPSGSQTDPTKDVATQIQVLLSAPVKSVVKTKLGAEPDVSAAQVGDTAVIEVRANSTDPSQAAAIANAYANSYVEYRRKQSVDNLLAIGQELQPRIDSLQKQVDQLNSQINSAPACSSPSQMPSACAQRDNIQSNVTPRRDALVNQQQLYKQRLDQLQVNADLSTGNAELATPADVPTSPVSPKPLRSVVTAIGVGLILGIGLAFLFEYLDDSVKRKEDVEKATHGLTTLGLIPLLPTWKNRQEPRIVSMAEPNSSLAEAYRSLRTAVQFMALDQPMNVLQVTSPSAAEGKTTTMSNLAVALARAGQRVVMVDCDLRRPRIHDFFGLHNDVGFTSVLLGEVPLGEAVQEVPGERLLMILASGLLPPNPSELLASQRTAQILAALQSESDIVLIDSPPVLPVTDAAVLSARVDATLLVTRAGATSRRDLTRAVEVLRQVDAPLIGTVLNGVQDDGAYGYAYKYGYYYRREEPSGAPTAAPGNT